MPARTDQSARYWAPTETSCNTVEPSGATQLTGTHAPPAEPPCPRPARGWERAHHPQVRHAPSHPLAGRGWRHPVLLVLACRRPLGRHHAYVQAPTPTHHLQMLWYGLGFGLEHYKKPLLQVKDPSQLLDLQLAPWQLPAQLQPVQGRQAGMARQIRRPSRSL